jgi:uncharacterized DUF497 family protein
MILQASGFDWDRGNRAKCERHGLSVAVIEGLFLPARWPFSRTRAIRSERILFAGSAARKKGAAYSSFSRFGGKARNF